MNQFKALTLSLDATCFLDFRRVGRRRAELRGIHALVVADPGIDLVCAYRLRPSLARLDDIVLHRTWLGSVD